MSDSDDSNFSEDESERSSEAEEAEVRPKLPPLLWGWGGCGVRVPPIAPRHPP